MFLLYCEVVTGSLTHSLTLPPTPSAEPLGEVESVSDIVFSPELCGLALVLSSGRVTFVSADSTKLEPKVVQTAQIFVQITPQIYYHS